MRIARSFRPAAFAFAASAFRAAVNSPGVFVNSSSISSSRDMFRTSAGWNARRLSSAPCAAASRASDSRRSDEGARADRRSPPSGRRRPPRTRSRRAAARHDRARRLLGDVVGRGPVVAVLDQEPALAALVAARPHEHPRAAELLAVERELELALLQRGFRRRALRRPRALVPDHHGAAAVLAGRDHALELRVLDRVILDLHREPLDARIEGGPLRHGPREQHAVPFEAEVVVQRLARCFWTTKRASLRRRDVLTFLPFGSGVTPKRRFRRYSSRGMFP